MVVTLVHAITGEQREHLHQLYIAAHQRGEWLSLKSAANLAVTLDQCTRLLTAAIDNDTQKLIGFAIVTGSLTEPLLEDLIVDPHYRRQHVASMIVSDILSNPALNVAESIDLYCSWDLQRFYARFGFVRVRGAEGERCLLRKPLRPSAAPSERDE